MKKVYHDTEGNERTISQMVKADPEWAANRIQQGECAAERIAELEARERELVDVLKAARSLVVVPHPTHGPRELNGIAWRIDEALAKIGAQQEDLPDTRDDWAQSAGERLGDVFNQEFERQFSVEKNGTG